MKKLLFVGALAVMLVAVGPRVHADESEKGPEITSGVLFYMYSFFWNNTDFNRQDYELNGQTIKGNDSYNYNYGHGSMYLKAEWENVTLFTRFGAWGQFGMHSIFLSPEDPSARLLEGYLDIKNLIGPFSLKVGKMHFLYGHGLVDFSGGEDGQTGFLLYTAGDKFSLDLFYRKTQDNGGWTEMGFNPTPGSRSPKPIIDWNSWGVYPTFNLNKITVSPYFFHRSFGDDKPMWVGADINANPAQGVALKAEYVTMFGSDSMDNDYDGYAFYARADYTTTSGLNVGGAYMLSSGDISPDDGKNSTYTSLCENPFTFGHHKGWVGLGPAHLTGTAAGFSLQAPWSYMMSNIVWFNVHVAYTIKDVFLRLDFYKYDKHKVAEGSKDLGYELAGLAMTNLKGVNFGATVGLWTPGDHISKVLQKGDDARFGAYIFFAKSFDFKVNR